jgi:hypothetical protein
MTKVGTTKAHRNLLNALEAGLKSTAARVRFFEELAARRSEWDRLRASKPKAGGGRDEKKLEEWRNE